MNSSRPTARMWRQDMERLATDDAHLAPRHARLATAGVDVAPRPGTAGDRRRGHGSKDLGSVDQGHARCKACASRLRPADVQVVAPCASPVARGRLPGRHVRDATRSCRDPWIHVQDRGRLPSRPLLPCHGRQSQALRRLPASTQARSTHGPRPRPPARPTMRWHRHVLNYLRPGVIASGGRLGRASDATSDRKEVEERQPSGTPPGGRSWVQVQTLFPDPRPAGPARHCGSQAGRAHRGPPRGGGRAS